MNVVKVTLRSADLSGPACHKSIGAKAIIYNPFYDFTPYPSLTVQKIGDIEDIDILQAPLPRLRNKVAVYIIYSEGDKVTPRPRLLAVVNFGALRWYDNFQRRLGLIRRFYVSFDRIEIEEQGKEEGHAKEMM